MPWPSQSPGLNTIKHFWDYLDKKKGTKNLNEFWNILQEEWYNIPNTFIENLYKSKRVKGVITNKGGTKH